MYRKLLPKPFSLIVACQENGGISYRGKIPWYSAADFAYFKRITSQTTVPDKRNAIVMGRKTFDSIGKPLPGRQNYVITRNTNIEKVLGIEYRNDLTSALYDATSNDTIERVFVIGGADIYRQVLQDWHSFIDKTLVTTIDTAHECDCYFPKTLLIDTHYPPKTIDQVEENGTKLTFLEYNPRNFGEEEYLNLIRRILKDGTRRENRTGIDTISKFGERMEFDISKSIPFITTKRLAWKTVLRELLWFISGDTNNKTLQDNKVHIWDGNSTREYLDSIGLTEREEGDLGPVYGFQWRHFGAEYGTCHDDYEGKGIDQIKNIVDLLKNDPNSRRIILSAWNPKAQPDMALPPCHVLAQWNVRKENDATFLDCQMYQRSCDVPLGIPFNIASYSILTYMLAHLTGMQPGKYIHVLGDAHVYSNHIQSMKEQLKRTPHKFPTLRFARTVTDIDDFREADFIIEGYQYHPTIKMDMVV